MHECRYTVYKQGGQVFWEETKTLLISVGQTIIRQGQMGKFVATALNSSQFLPLRLFAIYNFI